MNINLSTCDQTRLNLFELWNCVLTIYTAHDGILKQKIRMIIKYV